MAKLEEARVWREPLWACGEMASSNRDLKKAYNLEIAMSMFF